MAETNKPENPPAFACAATAGLTQTGMTLRDYFAAKAMQAYIGVGDGPLKKEIITKNAFEMADVMLSERSK